ncbi:MAG: NAD(P)H-hydrate dehydratase [Nonlabens sp.]
MKILSADQLSQADASTIEKQQISSIDLMERVATLVFNKIHERLNGAPVPIKVFCGIGKNGGDGLAIARHLIQHGYHVKVFITNCSKSRSPEFLKNYDRIKNVTKDWPVLLSCEEDFPVITEKDFIIDAIFGTGINRPITGWMVGLFEYLNNIPAFTAAIDMPSGLYANQPLENARAVLKADHTFTFQTPKLAFFLPHTGEYVGSFEVINIGLDPEFLSQVKPLAQMINREAAQNMYRARKSFTHKGNYGHVICAGGSLGKMGSIALAAGAAVNSGAGKVTAYIPKHGNLMLQSTVIEAMTVLDPEEYFLSTFDIEIKDPVISIGCGLGLARDSYSAFAKALSYQQKPMVIDADAIHMLAEDKDLLDKVPNGSILTPHDGELVGLLGTWKNDYERLEKAKKFTIKHDLILVLKGAYTITVIGEGLYVNDSGNPGMATGGSGDVLTGMIASFMAQGYDTLTATAFAIYIHGASADLAAQTYAHEGVKASIISSFVGPAILNLFRNPKTNQN